MALREVPWSKVCRVMSLLGGVEDFGTVFYLLLGKGFVRVEGFRACMFVCDRQSVLGLLRDHEWRT